MVQTMQPQALALIVLFPAVSTVVIALRVYIRLVMKPFDWDDALAVLAWSLAVAYAGVAYKWIKVNYFGYHIWDIPKPSLQTEILSQKLNMAQQLLYNPVLCIVKASVILFLLRLGDRRRKIRWPLIGLWWFNLGHMLAVFFGAMTQCLPIHMYWDHYKTDQVIPNGQVVNPNYSCFDEEAFSLITASLAILTDVFILCIPVLMMWNLRMPLRTKIAVIVVLSLGWVVTAISIVRFKVFYDYWQGVSKDPTYGLSQTVSGIEINVAIITCCGPALKALIMRFKPKFFGGSHASGTVYYSGGYDRSAYEMRSAPGIKSTHSNSGARRDPYAESMARDNDGESQKAIITNDSLGAKRVDFGFSVMERAGSGFTDGHMASVIHAQ